MSGDADAALRDLTGAVVDHLGGYRSDKLPDDAWRIAADCVLDWYGCAIAGSAEPAASLLGDELVAEQAAGSCTLVGALRGRASVETAALINGTASHALDYDDVNARMMGHPTVAIWPAVLAVAEAGHCSGDVALRAFMAGYELAASIGSLICPPHYLAGYHATGTIGTLAAAAAVGTLMDLSPAQMRIALGLAGTQAAGLKCMFGSMAKPFHAGKAASNGVLAARLAQRGYSAHAAVLDDAQGFVAVLGRLPAPPVSLWWPEPGTELRNNLFKQHAMCLETHSTAEATQAAKRGHGFTADEVERVEVHVTAGHLKVCNIQDPATGLECKFSLRHAVASALVDAPTQDPAYFSDENARRADLAALRERVTVLGDVPGPETFVTVRLKSGAVHAATYNIRLPASDLPAQSRRLQNKFRMLVRGHLAVRQAERLESAILGLRRMPDVNALGALSVTAAAPDTRIECC